MRHHLLRIAGISRPMALVSLLLAGAVGGLFLGSMGCAARRALDEVDPGWHSPSFSVVFGQLQLIPGPTPESPPVWTILFGRPNDTHQGRLALTPGERMVGYRGGERVQLRGRFFDQPTSDAYNGRWYVVDSIQMWSGHR